MRKIYTLIIPALLATTSHAAPYKPDLLFPVDCELSQTCYIQHYVDLDPSLEKRDVGGGRLTTEGHGGTDIALPTYDEMKAGVDVYAAEDGKVLRIRDSVDDNDDRDYEFDSTKPCGNGVVIRHRNNYQTQYCHLKAGSIAIKKGQWIKKGTVIGQVGASGHADFPHLHFVVRRHGHTIDPFEKDLWSQPLIYKGTGLIDMGMADKPLNLKDVLKKAPEISKFTPYDPSFVAWVRVYGVEAGDKQQFIFFQPDGKTYSKPINSDIPKSYREWFAYAGFPITEAVRTGLTGKWRVRYEFKQADKNNWVVLGERDFEIK